MNDQDPAERLEAVGTDALPASEPPVPTEPVARLADDAARRPGRSRLRWAAALVVTALVVTTAAGATMLLTGDAGDPDVLAWTPADSVMYAELRLDLPGSQRADLARFMSAFPGFDDQAAFDTKLGEALDRLVKEATDGKHDYRSDIDPWFGGQLAVSVGPLPASLDEDSAGEVRALLLASVEDAAKAEAWAAKLLADSGATSSTESYEGTVITTVAPPAGSEMGETPAAYAVLGPVLALGDPASVKAAIDTKGGGQLAKVEQFRSAEASVSGDRLAFAYVDLAALETLGSAAAGSSLDGMPSLFGDMAAPWGAAAIRAVDGSLVIDTRQPHVDKLGPAANAESKIAGLVPPDTVFLATGHDVGSAIQRFKTLAAADPELADGVKQLDDMLMLVGGFGAVVDWMGDVGLAVTSSGDAVDGGLVVSPTSRADAARLFTQLRGFLELAGGGSGISVTEESYGGETIVIVDLGGLGGLAGEMTGGDVSGLPAEIKIAYAVTDDVVVLGAGSPFVKAVLDARGGPSLADDTRFSTLVARAGASHASLGWVDVAAIRGLVEAQIPAAERPAYDAEVRPYLAELDAIVVTNVTGDDLDHGTMIVTTKP